MHHVLEDEFIGCYFPDPKQAEEEKRQKYEMLSLKYKNQFVQEMISKKGTQEVRTCVGFSEYSYNFDS